MKKRSLVTYEKKYQFAQKHAKELKQLSARRLSKPWKFADGEALIQKAREEIGYSQSTAGMDILRNLLAFYEIEVA